MKHINKLLIIFLFSGFFTGNLFSQTFRSGFLLGACGSQIDGDSQSGYSKPGVFAGVFVKTGSELKKGLFIELYYIGKGALKKVEQAGGTSYQEYKVNLNYIEMPVMYGFGITKRVGLKGGIAPSYLFKAKVFDRGSELISPPYELRNIDFSSMFQADFSLNDKIGFNVKFSYSLLSIRNDIWWHNNNLCIGFRYNISKAE